MVCPRPSTTLPPSCSIQQCCAVCNSGPVINQKKNKLFLKKNGVQKESQNQEEKIDIHKYHLLMSKECYKIYKLKLHYVSPQDLSIVSKLSNENFGCHEICFNFNITCQCCNTNKLHMEQKNMDTLPFSTCSAVCGYSEQKCTS